MIFKKTHNNHGNVFLLFLLFLIIIFSVGYIIYTNKDFQRSHKKEINKLNFYLRDYKKTAIEYRKNIEKTIAQWRKDQATKTRAIADEPKTENRTFEQLLYDPKILEQEIPNDMVRHQQDEITICSFNANYLLNNSLADSEIVHLANIFRFCDISNISGLENQKFLKKITTLLKILRYDASFETSLPTENNKKITVNIYRNDKVKSLKPSQTFLKKSDFPIPPYFTAFKIGDFDFIIATIQTPANGLALASIEPLEYFYEALQNENQDIRDIIIFGDFVFRSESLSWDSASLLPNFARTRSNNENQSELLGNFWFKKNDLVEFNGRSGQININEKLFKSQKSPSPDANKPIWTQFKILPDDD